MLNYHNLTQQWRQEAADREHQYKEHVKECQAQIAILRVENQELKRDLETKIEQIEGVHTIRLKEQDELRKSVSEKQSLIDNMRVEIDKLKQLNVCLPVAPSDRANTCIQTRNHCYSAL